MSNERISQQDFRELLREYFPLDAVQVQEDVRVAQQHASHIPDEEASNLLATLSSGTPR